MQEVYDSLRREDDNCQTALKAAQDRLQAIAIGQFSTEDGESATLQDQIINTKREISNAGTELQTGQLKIKSNTEQLNKKKIEMKKTEAEYKRDSSSLGRMG